MAGTELQTSTLYAGRKHPTRFAQAPNGYIYMADGISKPKKWDGINADLVQVGVDAPTTALTLENTGDIADAVGTGGLITITSVNDHGLTTGQEVTIIGVDNYSTPNNTWNITTVTDTTFTLDGSSPSSGNADDNTGTFHVNGSISGDYTAYQRFVDLDGLVSNLSPVSGGTTASSSGQFVYTNVPIPTDSRFTSRQILRNTAGQTSVYYVDIDTTDLTATEFTSTKDDDTLSLNESYSLFDTDGLSIAARFAMPRTDKPLILYFNGRLWQAGDVTYDRGHVQVTNASASVTGVDVEWTSDLDGRTMYVGGDSYIISSVDSATTITLSENYTGTTSNFAVYKIRSAPSVRNTVYWSEAGTQIDGFLAGNGKEIGEIRDEVTALVDFRSFLYIFLRRSVYRFTYQTNPTDSSIFLSGLRGAVSDRIVVQEGSLLYVMDERGIYQFDGAQPVDISKPIQDLFFIGGDPDTKFSINWAAREFFHAVLDPTRQVIRWFVSLGSDELPRHALAFNYRVLSWQIESYPYGIGSSALVVTDENFSAIGTSASGLLGVGTRSLDGVQPGSGTLQGFIDSATFESFTDTDADFPSSAAGQPVAIVSGRGKGQIRLVTRIVSTTIRVDIPWTVRPDTTSKYQLGAIPWLWRSGRYQWLPREESNPRKVSVSYRPLPKAATGDMRIYDELDSSARKWDQDFPTDITDRGSVTLTRAEEDAVFDLQHPTGFAELHLDAGFETYGLENQFVQFELAGFSSEEAMKIYQLAIHGVRGPQGGTGE